MQNNIYAFCVPTHWKRNRLIIDIETGLPRVLRRKCGGFFSIHGRQYKVDAVLNLKMTNIDEAEKFDNATRSLKNLTVRVECKVGIGNPNKLPCKLYSLTIYGDNPTTNKNQVIYQYRRRSADPEDYFLYQWPKFVRTLKN